MWFYEVICRYAWADLLPWVMLGIRATPKEEFGRSAGEAALGHVLSVPGQLLPTTGPPVDTPAPPAVIPAAKRTYDEAAATPALERATHVYVQQGGGCGAAASRQLCGPLPGAGEGSRSLQAAARGEDRGGEQRPAEAPEQGKRHLRPLSLHAGGGPPGEDQDLLHDFRRSLGSYVAGTRNPRNNIVITLMCKSAKDFSLRNPPKELIKLIIRYKDRNTFYRRK